VTAFCAHLTNSSDQLVDVNMKSFNCVKAQTSGMKFAICVYGAKQDVIASSLFTHGNYFEQDIVHQFVSLRHRYPEVGFVELGANIEMFTLPAARNTNVLAVKPYTETIAW